MNRHFLSMNSVKRKFTYRGANHLEIRRRKGMLRKLALEGLECRRVMATFAVVSDLDAGPGTLRDAILLANANPGPDTITFAIPGTGPHTIRSGSLTSDGINPTGGQLPTITDTVLIDGYTQPGASPNTNGPDQGTNAELMIELIGIDASSNASGLVFSLDSDSTSSGSIVRGLVINRFGGNAIQLSNADDVEISGNFIGTDVTGMVDLGNNRGIDIFVAARTLVGGPSPAQRNLISGNNVVGVNVQPSDGAVSDVHIQGNLIGTNKAGTGAIANTDGIIDHGVDTLIGGQASNLRNVISGNSNGINTGGPRAVIQGNYIGTDVTGTSQLGNIFGVIGSGDSILVGGTQPGAGNLISGNSFGLRIGNDNRNSSVARAQGNLIGTDRTGLLAIANGIGIECLTTQGTVVIGGSTAAERNIISGSITNGIRVAGSKFEIQGNFIGLNLNGAALANGFVGIAFEASASDNLVGGKLAGQGNVISANNFGIQFQSTQFANKVQGNLIGTDPTGTIGIRNSVGIVIDGKGQTIGGTLAGEGNVIAFNDAGVRIDGPTSIGNAVLGNSIHSNSIIGIDIGDAGVNANDSLDQDRGANELQNRPVIQLAESLGTSVRITGILQSAASQTYRVEFFANDVSEGVRVGEGKLYLGFANVGTDAAGNGSFSVTLPVSVALGKFISATATDAGGNTSEFADKVPVVIGNDAPTASISGPGVGVRGQTRSFTIGATDSATDRAAGFVYAVNWGDGSPVTTIPRTPGNTSIVLSHTYSSTGVYSVVVTATDQFNAVSAPVSTSISIASYGLQPDPIYPGKNMLVVGGTNQADDIEIQRNDGVNQLKLSLNGADYVLPIPTSRIVVYGQNGDDDIRVNENLSVASWLFGGNGDDRLRGGAGNNLLIGGDGSDLLVGQNSRDLLIGGLGADRVVGNADEDILIAGTTSFDANEAALAAIMAEWASSLSYGQRRSHLIGTTSGGANGSTYLQADVTVFDDNASDRLTGSDGQDWFFANLDSGVLDRIADLQSGEFAQDLDFILGL